MDAPGVPDPDVHAALRELEIVGRRLGGYNVAIGALERLIRSGRRVTTVMDLGCGGGDTIRTVARWALRKGHRILFTGLDRNPAMIAWCTHLSKDNRDISYITSDVFDDALLCIPQHDVVMSSLFCHHFDDALLIQLLQRMMALSGEAVVVNDLHRHPAAWWGIRILTKLFSRSYLVRYDAPLSVARAFTRADWKRLLSAAGIEEYSLRWCWAWRWQLIIPKTDVHAAV